VVHGEVENDADAVVVRRVDDAPEVVEHAVGLVDGAEVRRVVARVPARRRIDRQQADAVDAEEGEVLEPLREAAQISRAVVVRVEESADVDLVEDRRLEPAGVERPLLLRALLGSSRQGRLALGSREAFARDGG
jgi:hypothetical protein